MNRKSRNVRKNVPGHGHSSVQKTVKYSLLSTSPDKQTYSTQSVYTRRE